MKRCDLVLLFILISFLLESCTLGTSSTFKTVDEVANTTDLHLLHNHYDSKSERPLYKENAFYDSEFEFIKSSHTDSTDLKLLVTINSFRTGSALKKQILFQIDNQSLILPFAVVNIDDFDYNYSTTTSTPRTETVCVNVPASTQEVKKADGSTETVTIPSTTQTQTVTVYDNTSNNHTDLLRKEQAVIKLNSENRLRLKNAKSIAYKVYYEYHGVWLSPNESQLTQLKGFL